MNDTHLIRIRQFLRNSCSHALFNSFNTGSLEYHRVIHSVKTAIACLIGLSLVKYFGWPSGQWVPITIIVVMSAQVNFGAALQKAYMRFLGTIAGVSITIITLLLFGTNLFAVFAVIFLACLVFAYIASSNGNISYSGVLGGTTLVLTLASAEANVHYAVTRGFYIVVGIVIALLVSRFVFPIHAREKLRINVAINLRNLRRLYSKTIRILQAQDAVEAVQQLDVQLEKNITDNFAIQPQLIEEAAIGSHYFSLHKKSLFAAVVGCERKIYRLIYFMHKDLYEDKDMRRVIRKINSLENLHIVIEGILDKLAIHIEDFSPPQLRVNFAALLTSIELITNELPPEQSAQKLLDEHSFLFFMEQLLKELEVLNNLVCKINTQANIANGEQNGMQ